ncbi:hypothetical protein C8R45DRAFT_1130591 [Mycena sanguinolenta]|nr:hypothetical protein C8R45DRAFT_1130591 [Mycena sanguinolenta]
MAGNRRSSAGSRWFKFAHKYGAHRPRTLVPLQLPAAAARIGLFAEFEIPGGPRRYIDTEALEHGRPGSRDTLNPHSVVGKAGQQAKIREGLADFRSKAEELSCRHLDTSNHKRHSESLFSTITGLTSPDSRRSIAARSWTSPSSIVFESPASSLMQTARAGLGRRPGAQAFRCSWGNAQCRHELKNVRIERKLYSDVAVTSKCQVNPNAEGVRVQLEWLWAENTGQLLSPEGRFVDTEFQPSFSADSRPIYSGNSRVQGSSMVAASQQETVGAWTKADSAADEYNVAVTEDLASHLPRVDLFSPGSMVSRTQALAKEEIRRSSSWRQRT